MDTNLKCNISTFCCMAMLLAPAACDKGSGEIPSGDVDFIWGYVRAALFESCEIRSCPSSRGYIVQARCRQGDRGFVFLDCSLTAESGTGDGSVYLARSGGNSGEYDNVTYISCKMGSHIADAGRYSSPAPTPAAATAENGWNVHIYGSHLGNASLTAYMPVKMLTHLHCSRFLRIFAGV